MTRSVLAAALVLIILGFGCSSGTDSAVGTAVDGAACSTEGMQTTASDGCNLCRCASGQWSCSEVDCATECADGQRQDDGCNVCVCETGRWSCTRATCGDDQCSTGDQRPAGDGCNTCTCSGGTWSCTERDCTSCEEGEAVSDNGCNSCVCSGGQWLCTDVECHPDVCVDGETRSGTCEYCTCEGGQWLCTGTPCAQPICPEPTTDPGIACPAVVVYARDPDSGMCCEYGDPCRAPAAWEQFYSMAECETPGSCTPGETRPDGDGCNTCSCMGDGTWACTLRACLCEPGRTQRAADGCNVCTCSESSTLSCTEMACSGPVTCGGMAGNACTDDEYCAYEPGAACGAADATATCKPRPLGCDEVFDPVCGCDGQTYENACRAAAAGTGVLVTGPCPDAG